MFVVGITGGIGSGKSTVTKLFSEKGIHVIDTDQIAREVTEPNTPALEKIKEKFGANIILANGTLDRSQLKKIIFINKEHREWLENLLHPLIRDQIKLKLQNSTSPYSIVVIPLLFETKPNPVINRVLVIDATEEQQISRASLRDKLKPEELSTILKTQISREKRLALANDVIYNTGSITDLVPQVNNLHEIYLSLAKQSH